MAYLFGISNTDAIDCGTTPPKSGTFSAGIRFRPTQAIDTTFRRLLHFSAPGNLIQFYVLLAQASGHVNQVSFGFSTAAGTAFAGSAWDSGFTAGSLHTVVCVYDQVNQLTYADTDPSPKATTAETRVPDQDAAAHFYIGNATDSLAADSTIYEVFWAPGIVYTGAQCAQFGAGFDARFLGPKPKNHWRLIADARDLIGGAHGTVTGATLVAHNARIFYPAPPINLKRVTPFVETPDPPTYTVGPKVEIVSHATLAALPPSAWFWPDSGIGILNNNDGTYTFFASVGGGGHTGAPGRTVGTMSNPLSVSASERPITGRKDAPDCVIADFSYQGGGPVYKDPASGMLIMFSHNERAFPLVGQYYSWLGILKSTDGGLNWVDCGTIITPHHTYADMDALYTAFGKSDGTTYAADIAWGAYVIVGSYFYVHYRNCDGPVTSTGLTQNQSCLARALVADVVTDAAAGNVGVWHKYNAGTWTELGIRGTGTAVTDPISAISYNTFRSRYILLSPYADFVGDSPDNMIMQYRESVDGLAWSNPQRVTSDIPRTPFQIYASMVDPASLVPYQTGKSFYFISKRFDADDPINRFLITLDDPPGGGTSPLLTVLQHAGGGRGD